MSNWRTRALLALVCALFIIQALPFIQRLGIEVDEALVGNGIYERGSASYSWRIGDAEIPVMLLSYLGALKCWLYSALFAMWRPGPTVLRLPMALVAAAVIWLLFRFLDAVHGRRAAWIGALLLATDSSYLLTASVDYGPVALQHLFKLGAVMLLVAHHRDRRNWRLAAAFFLLGLAVWDKAIFIWVLAGLLAGLTAVRPRWFQEYFKRRAASIAATAFCAGAFPFIVYNVARPLEWVRQNARVTAGESLYVKEHQRRSTINGTVMFGFYTAAEPGPRPGSPTRTWQQASFALGRAAAEPRTNYRNRILWLGLFTIAVLAIVQRRRPHPLAIFSLVFLITTWLAMVLTSGAGAGAHHIVLLWPFHLILIAIALAELPWGPIAWGTTALICIAGLLVTNTYAVDLIRNGTAVRWTDAFPGLVEQLERRSAHQVYVLDWGILETINLMSEGSVQVTDGTGPLNAGGTELDTMLNDRGALYVTHTETFEQWPGLRGKLLERAAALGRRPRPVASLADRNARPVFEVFTFE